MSVHIVPDYTVGEKCNCGKPASHKVAEDAPMIFDQPGQVVRHAFTTYLCCQCFTDLMGLSPAACGLTPLTVDVAVGWRKGVFPGHQEGCVCAWCETAPRR